MIKKPLSLQLELIDVIKKLFILSNILLVCGCANIEKNTLKALKASEYSFIQKECELNKNFAEEPEFYTFAKTEFCTGEISITQLESISKSQSIVDYQITFKAKQRKLRKWLRAFKVMEARKLPSTQQQQVKAIIVKITEQKRDWIYNKQTVTLNLTENGWVVDNVIR